MKKIIFTFFLALMATTGLYAQQISVVSPGGSTSLYKTLQEAIEGAEGGSVIYLPGGGFTIADSVKITKKLTIIGIGHKSKNDNADSNSTITGNLFFNQGSDGSALMGCYVTGAVYIGNDGNEVDDILIRYNFLRGFEVSNNKCVGTTVNQNYCDCGLNFNGAGGTVSNNICHWVHDLDNGFILNNIITSTNRETWNSSQAMTNCDQTTISNNIIINGNIHSGGNCLISGNMTRSDWGDDCYNVGDVDWNTVFENWNNGAVNPPTTNFHFKEEYSQYEGKVGIYHGTFNENQLAPVPYIVAKRVDEQTDASGKLNVKIRVKAGQ